MSSRWGGGKRSYGGGGGGGNYSNSSHQARCNGSPRPTELRVLTNQNRLLPLPRAPGAPDFDCVQYEVSIRNAFWGKVGDGAAGELVPEGTGGPRYEFVPGDEAIGGDHMDKFARGPFPWRIMKRFSGEHRDGVVIAYNGNNIAYSPSSRGPEVGREYRVEVKKDCEWDDADKERVKSKWFTMTFKETKTIRFADVAAVLRGDAPSGQSEEITNMLNVIFKSTTILTSGMISLESNSSAVFFPLHEQQQLLDRKAQLNHRDGAEILLSGLEMTVNSQRGGAYLQTESRVKYANKEIFDIFPKDQRHQTGRRVPLLMTGGRGPTTIAGVQIRGDSVPDRARKDIELAIGKMTVIIEYKFRSQKDGKDVTRLYKNKQVRRDNRSDDSSRGQGQKILWSACDPAQFTFDYEGQPITVADFFKKSYGISLRFPSMPIIYVDNIGKGGRGGWLPIEFAYQAFEKSKENGAQHVQNILKYYDATSGKDYIKECGRKTDLLSNSGDKGFTFRDQLDKWGFKIDHSPVEETAKALKAPQITFKGNTTKHANNGSFDLKNVKFPMPAKVVAFTVLDYTGDVRSCNEFINTTMRVAYGHGLDISSQIMEISQDVRYLALVTERYNGRDPVGDATEAANETHRKGIDFYCHDSHGYFKEKNIFFETSCYDSNTLGYSCLVLPPNNRDDDLGLLLEYSNKNGKQHDYFSHRIETNDGHSHDVRLMVKITCTSTLIDPFDFRYDSRNKCNQALYNDTWRDANFAGYCYLDPKTKAEFVDQDIKKREFVHSAKDYEVEFSSIMFVYKPDEDKALYDRIKVISNCCGEVPSQCAVMANFKKQRNKDQYASNIAYKMNGKLSKINAKAISWTDGGIPWIGEAPTMVIGVGMVHGQGRAAKTVVAASLCLDSGCMPLSQSCFVQNKPEKNSDIISASVIKDIIKGSIERYHLQNKCYPERLLFHRDGLSDGNFGMANVEIASIKEAINERLGYSIPITFTICQSQQLGFRMVPSMPTTKRNGRPEANVPSGTVLEGINSFYMIAQGGMKGTSKPVKHIVHLNENEDLNKSLGGLTLQNLINCSYQMCWKYASATKCVRELPTIKYAKKLANQNLSQLPFLVEGVNWFGNKVRLVCPLDYDDTLTEEEGRPYLEVESPQGVVSKRYNIVDMPFHDHLVA